METRTSLVILYVLSLLEISNGGNSYQHHFAKNEEPNWNDVPTLRNKGYISEGVEVLKDDFDLPINSEERESQENSASAEGSKEVIEDDPLGLLPEEMTYSGLKRELYGERAKLERYLKHVEGRSHNAFVSRLLEIQQKYSTEQRQGMLDKNIGYQKAMMVRAGCSPKANFMSVKDVYNTFEFEYYPHTIVLYTCNDDSSCCAEPTDTCIPEKKEEVELFFQVSSVRLKRRNEIKPLLFVNHTTCQCVNKEEYYRPRTQPENPGKLTKSLTKPPAKSEEEKRQLFVAKLPILTERLPRCLCPVGMSAKRNQLGCLCECHSQECSRITTGRTQLTKEDRQCIEQGICSVPECKFGEYSQILGSCPTQEKT